MKRTHWHGALLHVGLLAVFGCSSDDAAPVDMSSSGGSDSGADHSAAGAAGTSGGGGGVAGSNQGGAGPDATTPDSSAGGAQADSDLPEAPRDATPEGDVAQDSAIEVSVGDAGDAASDVAADAASDVAIDTPGDSAAAGCASGATCTSGACTNSECERCQNDFECAAGNVCGSGVCAPSCNLQNGCSTGLDCCGGHCVSFARDIRHCGACPSACDLSQFCSSTGCAAVSIANLCSNAKTTMLLNANVADNAANAVLQMGLTTNCSPPPTAGQSAQTNPGPINPITGQPVAGGGDLITVAGGYFVQSLVDYLDKAGVTPVYLARGTVDHWRYFRRGGGPDAGADGGASDALVAEIAMDENGVMHDIVLIETVRDPASGTLVLIVFGQLAQSTAAAASYVANQMLPVGNRASYGKSWYVYDWKAANEAGPETFTPIASAP